MKMTLSLEQAGGTGRIEFATSSDPGAVADVAASMTQVISVPCELVIAFAPDDQPPPAPAGQQQGQQPAQQPLPGRQVRPPAATHRPA